jgi:hypothetical protein
VERPPISFLRPSLWLIPSAEGFHSSAKFIKVRSRIRPWEQGGLQPSPPCFFWLRASGKGYPYLFISRFSVPLRPVGASISSSSVLAIEALHNRSQPYARAFPWAAPSLIRLFSLIWEVDFLDFWLLLLV